MNPPPRLFFAHANGYTPGAYEAMLQPLVAGYRIEAPALLPLRTGQAPSGHWDEIANDLADQIDREPCPTLGVGHSLGAAALLMAAAAKPSRFSHLVLIEPPAVPALGAALLRHAPAFIRRKSPMAVAARRHGDRWASFDQAYAQERSRRWYERVTDDTLANLLRHGLEADSEGCRLRFRKEWEARLYETPTSVWPLLKRQLPPITLLRGAASRVFDSSDLARWRRQRPGDRVIEVAGAGHLLPLEQPQAVVQLLSA